MDNFIELTCDGKPVLVNVSHVVSIAPSKFGTSYTDLNLDCPSTLYRVLTSSKPEFETIRHEYITLTVTEDYAAVRQLLGRP